MLRAWNANDLEAHIAPYADSATWMTGTGVLKGKAAIRESLVKSFKRGDDLLGELAFSNTTLIWKKVNGTWRIMHDHSS